MLFNVGAYAIPLAVLPFVLKRHALARRIAALSFFVAPLVGAVTFLMLAHQVSIALVVATYVFALVPLGFWAALMAVLLLPVLDRFLGWSSSNVVAAGVGGAFGGGLFMLTFLYLASETHNAPRDVVWWPHVASGVSSGAVIAVLAAWEIRRRDSRLSA